jgi:hypothetical protein
MIVTALLGVFRRGGRLLQDFRLTRTWAIVERSHRAFDYGALDAALDCLMVKPQRPTNRKKRRILSIGEQYSRPLDPACRFGPRLRIAG